jgi:hypothetical protein
MKIVKLLTNFQLDFFLQIYSKNNVYKVVLHSFRYSTPSLYLFHIIFKIVSDRGFTGMFLVFQVMINWYILRCLWWEKLHVFPMNSRGIGDGNGGNFCCCFSRFFWKIYRYQFFFHDSCPSLEIWVSVISQIVRKGRITGTWNKCPWDNLPEKT